MMGTNKSLLPFDSPPYFFNRFAVDVLYDCGAIISGGPLRCFIEVRRPAIQTTHIQNGTTANSDNHSEDTLGYITFQLIGVLTVKNPEYACMIESINAAHEGKDVQTTVAETTPDIEQFYEAVLENKNPSSFVSDINESVQHASVSLKKNIHAPIDIKDRLPDICYNPYIDDKSIIFMKSFPQVICRDEVFSSQDNDAIHTFGFECLVPPFLPPTFLGVTYRYSYYLSVISSRDSISMIPYSKHHTCQILLPVHILGPDKPGAYIRDSKRLVLDEQFLNNKSCPSCFIPSCHTLIDSFNFCTLSWKGGTPLCQNFFLPGLSSSLGISQLLNTPLFKHDQTYHHKIYSSEVAHILHLLALEVYYKQHIQTLTVPYNDSQSVCMTAEPTSLDYHHLTHFWDWDDDYYTRMSARLMPKIEETFRICHEECFITLLRLLGPVIPLPPQLYYPRPFFEKISHPPYSIRCPLGGSVAANFNFLDAEQDTIEIHVLLIKEEVIRRNLTTQFPFNLFQFGLSSKNNFLDDLNSHYIVHRQIISEMKYGVCHTIEQTIIIDIPANLTPTFSTDLISLNYILLFQLFCYKPDNKKTKVSTSLEQSMAKLTMPPSNLAIPKTTTFPSITSNKLLHTEQTQEIVEVYWSVDITLIPPDVRPCSLSNKDLPSPFTPIVTQPFCPLNDLSEAFLGQYNSMMNCWDGAQEHRRIHRGFLI